jgi:hypothetical protein
MVKQPEGPPRALLLPGFAGAFRRSALVALDVADRNPRTFLKIIIRIRRSTPSGDADNLGALFHSGRLDRVPVTIVAAVSACLVDNLTLPSDKRYRSATR